MGVSVIPASRLLAVISVVFAVLVSGCDLLTDAEPGLEITNGATLDVPWAGTVALEVRDGSGAVVSGDDVDWTTDHAGIATVSAAGVVRGEGLGSTVVRASYDGQRASIRVHVVVAGATDIMRIRITGDVEEEYHVHPGSGAYSFASGIQAEFPDRPLWQFGFVQGETYSLTYDHAAGVVFALPGGLSGGVHELAGAVPADLVESGLIALAAPIAYLYRETTPGTVFTYPAGGGTLELDDVEELTVSFADGTVRGEAVFPADEYLQVYDTATGGYTARPTGRTVDVAVEFGVPAGIYLGGFMDLEVDGGAYATPETIEGWADGSVDPEYGTTLVLRARDHAGVPVDLVVTVEDPAVGTHTVGAGVTARWRQYESAGYLEAGGESGTVTVDEVTPPTAAAWGMIRGTVDVTLRVGGASDQAFGEPVAVTGRFEVPVSPFAGTAGAQKSSQ